MTLQHCNAVSGKRVPHTYSGVQTTGSDDLAVKRNCIYLVEVSTEDLLTFACIYVPEPASTIIASTDDSIPANVQLTHATRVPRKNAQHPPTLYIPHAQRAIPRPAYRNRAVVYHLEAAHCRGMSTKDVQCETSPHVPHAHVFVATTAHHQRSGLAPSARRASDITACAF